MDHWKSPLATFLNLDEIAVLLRSQREVAYNSKNVLFEKGQPIEHIMLICFGSVSLEAGDKSSAERIVYSFRQRGDFLGLMVYLDDQARHEATARCLESTKVLLFPKDIFLQLAGKSENLRNEVKNQVAKSFRELQEDRHLLRQGAPRRLAQILLSLYENQRDVVSQSIPLPLSRADLARRVGIEPETAIRILCDWESQGILKKRRRLLEVCDYQALRRRAGFDVGSV